jgi:hypothetical protein
MQISFSYSLGHILPHLRPGFIIVNSIVCLLLTVGWTIAGGQCLAQQTDPENAVEVKAVWSVDAGKPGQQVVLAIPIDVALGFSIGNAADLIPDEKKDQVLPTKIEFAFDEEVSAELKSAIKIGDPSFPGNDQEKTEGNNESAQPAKLEGQVIVYIPLELSDSLKPGQIPFVLKVTTQVCTDTVCYIPKTTTKKVNLKIVESDAQTQGCPSPELFKRWNERRNKKASDKKKDIDYKSKEPPVGPAWTHDLQTAQQMALKTGKPIFLYSTKTFCPHCVVVESEMLSAPELKPYYDRAIWLYVYQDFSGSDTDKRARRIADRYSLTSWPQLWLINPYDLSTIKPTGRSVDSFAKAVANIDIAATTDMSPVEQLKKSEAITSAFESAPNPASALQLIKSDDVVAQLAAVNYLIESENGNDVVAHAKQLLASANDSLRYKVLDTIAQTGQGDAQLEIAALVKNPQPSRNYNVLRSHAIKALASCGDQTAVDVIAPHAKGSVRNSTTRIAIDALTKIADRHPASRDAVAAALAESFPEIEQSVERMVTQQAKTIHDCLNKLTDRNLDFPATYDTQSRTELITAWSKK